MMIESSQGNHQEKLLSNADQPQLQQPQQQQPQHPTPSSNHAATPAPPPPPPLTSLAMDAHRHDDTMDYVCMEAGHAMGGKSRADGCSGASNLNDYVASGGRFGSIPEIIQELAKEQQKKKRKNNSSSSNNKNNNNNNTTSNDDDDSDDDNDDNHSVDSNSSVLTADGIHDVTGFYCVCGVILIGDMSRGVMFPSMWPLVEALGGSQVLLGYAVASFSFGRVLVNPLFGAWSHSIGYSKTLVLASTILAVGCFLYSQIQNIGYPEALIVAQTILGIGSGTLGVTRAFVADVTAKRNRTRYMALITAVQYGGFTVTPIVGALFNYTFQDKDYRFGLLRFNMFTMPAYFMLVVVVAVIVCLLWFFQDRHRVESEKEKSGKVSERRAAIDEYASGKSPFCGVSIYDCCILGCMLLNVSTKGSIASFETLGIAIAQSHFDMLSSRAGAIVAACGACGVVSLLNMGFLEQHFSDVSLITGGMVVMTAGILSLSDMKSGVKHPSWRYAFAMFLIYSIGYPIGHTAVIGLFSKSKWVWDSSWGES